MIDDFIVKGWDKFGIHCWNGIVFPSIDFVEENSESITLVERTVGHSYKHTFNFRKYFNQDGKERFVMLDVEANNEKIFSGTELNVYLTDSEFFKNFIDDMLAFEEISRDDYDILDNSITQKPQIGTKFEIEFGIDPFTEEHRTHHSTDEIDELENL